MDSLYDTKQQLQDKISVLTAELKRVENLIVEQKDEESKSYLSRFEMSGDPGGKIYIVAMNKEVWSSFFSIPFILLSAERVDNIFSTIEYKYKLLDYSPSVVIGPAIWTCADLYNGKDEYMYFVTTKEVFDVILSQIISLSIKPSDKKMWEEFLMKNSFKIVD